MRFEVDDDQQMLREAVCKSFATLQHGDINGGALEDTNAAWRVLKDDLALFSLIDAGDPAGRGNSVEMMVVFEEAGRALLRVPILDTLVVAPILLGGGRSALAKMRRQQIAAGEARIGFAWRERRNQSDAAQAETTILYRGGVHLLQGCKLSVPGGEMMTHLLVTARDAALDAVDAGALLVLLVPTDAPGIHAETFTAIDGHAATDFRFDNVTIDVEMILHCGDTARNHVKRAANHAAAAICAEAVGTMRRLLDLTTRHVVERTQFRQPIADFQVIQHRIADMLIHLEIAHGATLRATHALADEAEPDSAGLAALVMTGQACRFIGENAIQLHGGMGIADETPVGGYFKRALSLAGFFGSVGANLANLSRARPIESLVSCG